MLLLVIALMVMYGLACFALGRLGMACCRKGGCRCERH